MASQQLNPPVAGKDDPDKVEVIEGMTDIDEGGVHVSGQPGGTKEYTAVPFVINLGSFTPPSVRLIPCRPYMVGTCWLSHYIRGYFSLRLKNSKPPKFKLKDFSTENSRIFCSKTQ